MNKKAQLGNIVSTFYIMFLIFIIMGIFLFLVTTISALKSPSIPNAIIPSLSLSNFNIIKITQQETHVIDAMQLYLLKKTTLEEIHSQLIPKLDSLNDCYLLYTEPSTIKGYNYNNGSPTPIINSDNYNKIKFTIKDSQNRPVDLFYYYGACP